jgi:hypothetical protein
MRLPLRQARHLPFAARPLAAFASDQLTDVPRSVTLYDARNLARNSARRERAPVDESSIHLYEVRPGTNKRDRVLRALDAADANDDGLASETRPHLANDARRARPERSSTQASGADRRHTRGIRQEPGAADCRIGRDDSRDTRLYYR